MSKLNRFTLSIIIYFDNYIEYAIQIQVELGCPCSPRIESRMGFSIPNFTYKIPLLEVNPLAG